MSLPEVVTDEIVNQFHRDGYVVIPNFLNQEQIEELKEGVKQVVQKYCQDAPILTFKHGQAVTVEEEKQNKNTYFAESADKIRGFFEENAVVDGKLIVDEKEKALNKIGHALHKFEDTFLKATFSPQVKEIINRLTKMVKPTVIQSMIIFKHPKVGGEVTAHQDATYLYADPPVGSLLGFWFALDEANEQNGCLHFIPGSHKDEKVYQRFITNPDKSSHEAFIHTGDEPLPFPREKLVAAPAKPGDLVLIDGLVTHHSAPNTSDKSRLAYTFHVIDMNAAYSPDNWLQPTSENTFVPVE